MKKRTKITLIIAIVILILCGLYCALILPLNGSIIHKTVLTGKVRDYVTTTYGEGFSVERAVYDFKINGYICHVKSDTSVDTHFTVYEGKDGKLTDHYDLEVLQKENTIWRLTREMDNRLVQDFLPLYPRECVNYMCYFEKEPIDRGTPEVREKFTLDMKLDMQNTPLPLELTLWVVCENPSWEALAESLRDAKETIDSLGWNVSLYSMTLHTISANGDEKPIDKATDFCVYQIPRDVIDGDGLLNYLKNINTNQ